MKSLYCFIECDACGNLIPVPGVPGAKTRITATRSASAMRGKITNHTAPRSSAAVRAGVHSTSVTTSCPFCRRETATGAVETALENATMYFSRSSQRGLDDSERNELTQLALAEVDKVLSTDKDDLRGLNVKGRILKTCDPE